MSIRIFNYFSLVPHGIARLLPAGELGRGILEQAGVGGDAGAGRAVKHDFPPPGSAGVPPAWRLAAD